ncbi:MAG TPA: TldD/PmbA family protein [Candidatus Aminicenantes bacterium]|nr:TldD/PmbA family protein [Candidatus Aminicenantes bacterium]HRY64385.1 TldD/PmbA family protein [Candidatus Aminicenantes bacterium]HRZ71298.1 TldD/PmbA family protein [Candidatus Aminicenantes bacterium]
MTQNFFSVDDIPRRRFLELGIKGGIALAAAPSLMSCIKAGQAPPPPRFALEDLNKVIRRALAQGGEFGEIYIENRVSRSILMEEGKFKSAVFGISQGAGVRVISGDKTGYAYTDDLTLDAFLRAADVASYVARGAKAVAPVDIREEKRPSFITVKVPLQTVAEEKRLEIMKRAHDAALGYDPRVKMASIDYYDEVRGRTIANSEGLYLTDELPLLFFVVQVLAAGNGTSHMGRERLSRHAGLEMFDELKPEDAARASARESVAMLEAKDAPAGKMDVVMQNGWGGVLVHEAVGHPLEGDNIARETGVFVGKLGRQVPNPKFTMVDDGSLPGFRGTTDFDDEGTPMKRNVLIQDGTLVKYMTDVLSAKQIKMERTGNGRRESFRYMPIVRMTNTFIEKGTDKPADILASTPSGLYVQSLSGGSVNPTDGVFNFTCREAYLIENGRKTVPVKGATLIGSCLDVIQGVDAVGDDLDFGPGICGKGQAAEVSAGQPTVRIRGINVGGSRAR